MIFEVLRLLMGLSIALFHRPIADFIMEQERVLVVAFRQRGIPAPMLTSEWARNIYFCLGIFIAVLEFVRIYGLLHPETIFFSFVGR